MYRAACAPGAIICGALAVVSASASAGGTFTTATLTRPTSGSSAVFTWSYESHENEGDVAVGFCHPGIAADAELASQHYALTEGQGVIGTISVTFQHDHEIARAGLLLLSPSGDGQGGDLVLSAPGPGPCPE